jgi:hypothetical protein
MAPEPAPPPPSPQNGKVLTWLNAVKGLSVTNVLVIAMLAVVAVPVYTIWKALGDEKLLDRFMSTFEELGNQQSGCTMRHVQERGGPDLWGISTGFAFSGTDKYAVNVVLDHMPTDAEIVSYCESLKLIADSLLARNGEME